LYNVRDIRSFSGTKWKKNLGEGRAEPRTVYPLLYAPSGAYRYESAAWSWRSGEVQEPEPSYFTKSYPTSSTLLKGSPVDL